MVGPGIGRRGLLGVLALAGCQQAGMPGAGPAAATGPRVGPNGVGYIAIAGQITNRVRDLFLSQVNQMLGQGATEIYLLLTSPGGPVPPAMSMIAEMERLNTGRGVRFTTHNIGAVAGGACYVFLAGQRRLSVPRGTFVFQGLTYAPSGAVTSQALQEAGAQMRRIEQAYTAMLLSRTRLNAAEASSFLRRTVILNADEARRDGIIDATAEFSLPPGATLSGIRTVPAGTGTAAPAGPAGSIGG